jgi:hypothetical protein
MRFRATASTAVAVALLFPLLLGAASLYSQEDRKPPRKPETPFRVHVVSSAQGEERAVAAVEEGAKELANRIRKNKNWFRLVETNRAAEIAIDVEAYWVREEHKVHSEPRYSAAYGTQWVEVQEVLEHHSLKAIATTFGTPREWIGVQVRKDGGSASGAARDLAEQLEDFVKENYWDLARRR